MKFIIFFFNFLFLVSTLVTCADNKKVYIVYIGGHKGDKALHEIEAYHHSFLHSVKGSEEEAKSSLLYSYKHSINGFAAELTPEEASKLRKSKEVVSVFESNPRKYKVHTTRSWDFIGLDEAEDDGGEAAGDDDRHRKHGSYNQYSAGRKFLKKAKHGDGIIVGLIDSGVWPESKSFHDEGMGPIPKSWRGICQTGYAFNSSNCNRKIIGARYYLRGYEKAYGELPNNDYISPRDADGHGSHTASIAVGRQINGVSYKGGLGKGSASGGAPFARLAIYKACWAIPNAEKAFGNACQEEDMLAAIDDAVGDGVDVISISIGSNMMISYGEDGIAVGAFHAVKKNVVVVASAGNDGPRSGSLANTAPWIFTVGASSLDRSFKGGLYLGNGYNVEVDSMTALGMDNYAPLVYAGNVGLPGLYMSDASRCGAYSLNPEYVRGKVVLCLGGSGGVIDQSREVKRAGGVAMILGQTPSFPLTSQLLPTAMATPSVLQQIFNYIFTHYNPTAFIKPAQTLFAQQPAPSMATFSSRGPNNIDPNILKPDIIAPGINILAAWSGADPPTKSSTDRSIVEYNFDSGTSMSCPHVAAAIALLKSIHPSWSSAALRSALMTTALVTNDVNQAIQDSDGSEATPFAIGAGHFNPTAAADPGLVYDISYQSYLLYGCLVGLTSTYECPQVMSPSYNLNYPSIAIPNLRGTVTVERTVTNVGKVEKDSTVRYEFSAKPLMGVSIVAEPNVLEFNRVGEKKRFQITFVPQWDQIYEYQLGQYQFGWFKWSDGQHVVTSPIALSLG